MHALQLANVLLFTAAFFVKFSITLRLLLLLLLLLLLSFEVYLNDVQLQFVLLENLLYDVTTNDKLPVNFITSFTGTLLSMLQYLCIVVIKNILLWWHCAAVVPLFFFFWGGGKLHLRKPTLLLTVRVMPVGEF